MSTRLRSGPKKKGPRGSAAETSFSMERRRSLDLRSCVLGSGAARRA